VADLERLIQAIDAAEQSAYGSESDSDLQTDRALAIEMYHGRNIEPAPEGRSQVNDRTVFETIHWILPSLCRIFANGDNVVEFDPIGEDDEEAAQQESDYLNYLVTQKSPWPIIFLTWAMDALTSKNGYCLPYVEEKLTTELETYERQSEESLSLLLQDEGLQVVEHSEEPDLKAPPQPVIDPMTGQPAVDPMTGQPVMQPPRMLHTVTIKRVKPKKKLCFKVIPPERTKTDIDTESFLLETASYFEYWEIVTISHLRALGFDVEDDIASGDEDSDETEEGRARDLYSEETLDHDSDHTDPSMRKVRARCIWIRHDTDEDGIAELQQLYRVGSEILEKGGKPAIYHCSRIPVACITPNINPHRHVGTSEADITIDIQRIKTAILRQGLDGLYLANNPRHVVSNEINLDDFLVNRPGGLVRMMEGSSAVPGEGHVFPIATQNVFPDAMAGLEYMGQVVEGRTGVSRVFSGVDPSTLNKGNSSGVAINQLSTMASQRVEQIARIFAVGVQYLFSVAHELVIKSGHEAETVKLRGKWTPIDPSTWKTGRDMRIVVGYGAGNKDALVMRLEMIRRSQMEAIQLGLPIANVQNLYETNIELTKASDFSAPQRFWTDPATVPPPPPPDPTKDIAFVVEQMKKSFDQSIAALKADSDERIKQAELLQKDQEARLKAEVSILLEQMKGGQSEHLERVRGSITQDTERLKIEGKEKGDEKKAVGGAVLDKYDEQLKKERSEKESLSKLAKQASEALDELNAPREVVRGKDGRVEGVKVGSKVRKAVRDKDGRISGLQ
jgi:hypothetical protein